MGRWVCRLPFFFVGGGGAGGTTFFGVVSKEL